MKSTSKCRSKKKKKSCKVDANEISVEQACFLCQVYLLEDIWQVDIQLIIKPITL